MKTMKESLIKNIRQDEESVKLQKVMSLFSINNIGFGFEDMWVDNGVVHCKNKIKRFDLTIDERRIKEWPKGWKVGSGINLTLSGVNAMELIDKSFIGKFRGKKLLDKVIDLSDIETDLTKDVDISYCDKLTHIILPKMVDNVCISHCNKLRGVTGLREAGDYELSDMPQIKTLEGYCPIIVKNRCIIKNLENMKSFEGIPEDIGDFVSVNNGRLRKRFVDQYANTGNITIY